MAAWLVQCNPRKYRIFTAISLGRSIRTFSVNQYRDQMSIGDDVALWVSLGEPGYPSGVYAAGKIRSFHWPGRVDPQFWVANEPGPDTFVDIRFDRNIFHHPISCDELRHDRDFRSNLILRNARGTSFPVDPDEWHAIVRRLPRRHPTSRPRLSLPAKGQP